MKLWSLCGAILTAATLAGCGGGGGGGSTTPTPPTPPQPPAIPFNTITATVSGSSAFSFQGSVKGAVASGPNVQVYGDDMNGTPNNYTSSRRLTINLYGPVNPGTYYITQSANHTAGSAGGAFLESSQQNGVLTVTNQWVATSGSVTVNAADGSHVEGTFTMTLTNKDNGKTLSWGNGQFNLPYDKVPGQP